MIPLSSPVLQPLEALEHGTPHGAAQGLHQHRQQGVARCPGELDVELGVQPVELVDVGGGAHLGDDLA